MPQFRQHFTRVPKAGLRFAGTCLKLQQVAERVPYRSDWLGTCIPHARGTNLDGARLSPSAPDLMQLSASKALKRKRIHHVGIVLPTREAVNHLMTMFDLEEDYHGYVEAYQADHILTKHGEHESAIEFIIPREGSVLKNFNDGKGGVSHIAFEVDDVEAVRREFEAKGLYMLEQKAKSTEDLIFNFMRPRYSEHILFEFVQTVAPSKREPEEEESDVIPWC